MAASETRARIARLLQQRPFQPFAISLENGDPLTVEHPENVAYDPTGASMQFTVLGGGLATIGNFKAVTSISRRDTGEPVSS